MTENTATWGEGGLSQTFARVVARYGNRPAMPRADGKAMASYRDLDRLSCAVAKAVLAARAPAHLPVLLFLEPGLALASAMFGVWRAGRFFVALDPVGAQGRNARIAEDAGAEVAISDPKSEIPGPAIQARIGFCEGSWLATLTESDSQNGVDFDLDLVAPNVARTAFAALTYTSGSTGRPKGLIQTHGSILRNAALTRDALSIGPDDRATWLYPPSVNPTLRDLTSTLLSGAELWPFDATSHDAEHLASWLAKHEITVLCLGVTLFRQLAAAMPAGLGLPHIRAVKLGGEPVGAREIALFRRLFSPAARLYFGLGTTETGTVTTCFMGHTEPLPSDAFGTPLGCPAADVEITLLDADGERIITSDAVGEIAVSGADFAAGYWNDPERTREVFGAPFGYRTGDLARRDAAGDLWYLGRASAGLKIRGLRIEVAEVERALAELPGVEDAAVVAARNTIPRDDDPELLAFVVPRAGQSPSLTRATLRRALATRLPQAMIPTRFRVVRRLPLTTNGKLDRNALAVLADDGATELPLERTLTYPRDPIETRLAALWCEVLGHQVIGIDESFFDLGGTSRTAVTLFAAIERRFGIALPLALLFEAQTVREQAVSLRSGLSHEGLAPAISVNAQSRASGASGAIGSVPRLFCVPAVDGYAFVYRPLAAALDQAVNVVVLQFPGLDGKTAPLTSADALASELVRRMRATEPRGPYALFGHSYGGLVAYEMVRLLIAQGETVDLLALCDSHTPTAVPRFARLVRDGEKLALAARRIWRETRRPQTGLVQTTVAATRALAHTAFRAFQRRGGRTLVEHTLNEVRSVSLDARLRHRFGAPLDLPTTRVVLYRAAPERDAAHRWLRFADASNGWAEHFVRAIDIHDVQGDHIQMLNPPNVDVIASSLAAEIATARGGTRRVG